VRFTKHIQDPKQVGAGWADTQACSLFFWAIAGLDPLGLV